MPRPLEEVARDIRAWNKEGHDKPLFDLIGELSDALDKREKEIEYASKGMVPTINGITSTSDMTVRQYVYINPPQINGR